MSAGAIAFMLLTMGGVVALNVICVLAWIKARPPRPGGGTSKAPDSPT